MGFLCMALSMRGNMKAKINLEQYKRTKWYQLNFGTDRLPKYQVISIRRMWSLYTWIHF